jgi:hypothetical protein
MPEAVFTSQIQRMLNLLNCLVSYHLCPSPLSLQSFIMPTTKLGINIRKVSRILQGIGQSIVCSAASFYSIEESQGQGYIHTSLFSSWYSDLPEIYYLWSLVQRCLHPPRWILPNLPGFRSSNPTIYNLPIIRTFARPSDLSWITFSCGKIGSSYRSLRCNVSSHLSQQVRTKNPTKETSSLCSSRG